MSNDETRIDADEAPPNENETPARLVIPHDQLSASALSSVIEEYATREGTEYGPSDVPLADKVRQIRAQLDRGDVVLLFDAKSESVNLVTAREARAFLS